MSINTLRKFCKAFDGSRQQVHQFDEEKQRFSLEEDLKQKRSLIQFMLNTSDQNCINEYMDAVDSINANIDKKIELRQ